MPDGDGHINSCASSGCGWRCCQFQQGNYIVMYPDELEKAQASGLSTAHLKVIDDNYHGGKKVVCSASNTASCDNGYKPLDCVSYPFFPDVDPETKETIGFIKGTKCPLQTQHLQIHWQFVQDEWNKLIAQNPAIAGWLGKVEMVGYTEQMGRQSKPDPAVLRKRAAG